MLLRKREVCLLKIKKDYEKERERDRQTERERKRQTNRQTVMRRPMRSLVVVAVAEDRKDLVRFCC